MRIFLFMVLGAVAALAAVAVFLLVPPAPAGSPACGPGYCVSGWQPVQGTGWYRTPREYGGGMLVRVAGDGGP